MNRIDRLSAILILLQSRSLVKAGQIAERFEISLRTVYRDMKALEESGIPIIGNPGIGYSLMDGFKLPPLMLTHEEALSFLIAEKLVNELTDTNSSKHYRSGIEKIRAVMRYVDKEALEAVNESLCVLKTNKPAHYKPDVLLLILQSIQSKQTILMRYSSHERQVEVVGLFFSKSNWYMIAFCLRKMIHLTFRIDRIEEIEILETPHTKKYAKLSSFLDKFLDEEQLHEITISINKEHRSMVGDDRYYYGLTAENKVNDVIEYHFKTFSLEKFARWYLSFADVATIIKPEALKEIIRGMIRKIEFSS